MIHQSNYGSVIDKIFSKNDNYGNKLIEIA